MIPALLYTALFFMSPGQYPAGWMDGWAKAFGEAKTEHMHVIVLSDSTARVDQTSGVRVGPDRRADLWPEQLQAALHGEAGDGFAGSGLLTLEGNAALFDRDIWDVPGRYAYNAAIGPYESELDKGQVPSNGGTVLLRAGETARLARQPGDTLWIYWASCPDSHSFSVAVDGKPQGSFGGEAAAACRAERTRVYQGPPGEHALTITANAGNAYLYAAEWTRGQGGVEVDNLSVGGATSDFFATPEKRAYIDVIPNVALAIVALGVNDYLHSVPPEEYRSNLSAMVGGIRRRFPQASILIVNQYRVLGEQHRNSLGVPQPEYGATARQVAHAEGVGFLDLSADWGSMAAEKARGLLTKDWVHPSDAGGREFACDVERTILPSRRIRCAAAGGALSSKGNAF